MRLIKKYLNLIKEGNSLKDKVGLLISSPGFIINYYLNKKKFTKLICNVVLKNKDGTFFCGNSISFMWCASSFHEPKLRRYFDIGEGVFVDVGAGIGKYTVMVGKKLKDKGRVIAIEPMPENFEILKKNVRLNDLTNVILVRCALGSKEKYQYLYLDKEGRYGLSHSLLSDSPSVTSNKIRVKVRKLDNLLKDLKINRIDLIKIDVEGAEAEVLKGAVKTLEKFHPKIIFEAWNEKYLKKVKRILSKFNYKIRKVDKKDYFAY